MTCIAAIKNKKGKICMAADRRMSWDDGRYQQMSVPKIKKFNDGIIIAGTGDCHFLFLILNAFDPPEIEYNDINSYMINSFKKELIKMFKQNEYKDEHNLLRFKKDTYLELVCAVKGNLYSLGFESGYNLEVMVEPSNIVIDIMNLPYATGSGGDYALGSLLETEGSSLSTRERLVHALNVAAKCTNGCDSNIDIFTED